MRLELQRAPLWRFRFAELFAFDRRPVPRQGNFARQWRASRTGPKDTNAGEQRNSSESRHLPSRGRVVDG
jgi:hypothetical protein